MWACDPGHLAMDYFLTQKSLLGIDECDSNLTLLGMEGELRHLIGINALQGP